MINILKLSNKNGQLMQFKPLDGHFYFLGDNKDFEYYNADMVDTKLKLWSSGKVWHLDNLSGQNSNILLNDKPFFHVIISEDIVLKIAGEDFTFQSSQKFETESKQNIKKTIYNELLSELSSGEFQKNKLSPDQLEEATKNILEEVVDRYAYKLEFWTDSEVEQFKSSLVQNLLKLGPLESLLADDSVTEIMVIDENRVYIEQNGLVSLSDVQFESVEHLMRIIERIVAPLGRRIDTSSPMVDARLADGSRVNAIIPPLAADGPCLTIRKFGKKIFNCDMLLKYGSVTEEMVNFIKCCVEARKNIVVSGGTGSGKTSLLNAISAFISNSERIVTIEDSLELKLQQPHVVRLEARPANADGQGAVTIRSLVINSLRMRPDRIVIGECRGGEALDMLQAMNTGHDGSLTTVHANTARDAVSRLETLVLMAGMELPLTAIRNQIASAVDLIIQTSRLSDGSRKIISITEFEGLNDEGKPMLRDIFRFKPIKTENKKVYGEFEAVNIPSFFEELRIAGTDIDEKWFAGVEK